MQKEHLLLCAASFTDVEIKHPPDKKLYWIRIAVDGKQVFESQKRHPGSSTSWKEKGKSFPFLPTSTFELSLVRKHWHHPISGVILGRFTGQPGEIVDFLDQSKAIHLEDLKGRTLSTTITINFSLETNAAQTIVDGIEEDLSSICQNKMADLAQKSVDFANQGYNVVNTLSTCIKPLGDALQAMAKIMDSIADAHPILKVAWTVLSSVYKAVKAQGILDGNICKLLNTLKEMLFVAKTVPDLFVVEGTGNVIDEIGKAAVEVAILMSEYMESSLAKRTMKYQMSNSMKDRIDGCQDRCKSLQKRFDRRMQLGVARDVEHIKLRDVLGNLAYVKDASWAPELCCLAGTREEPIKRILAWIDQADPSKPAEVLLVAEVTGAGKTALAHSIGHRCQEKGLLKTSFFFQRDSAELSTPIKFISTLALDLSSDGAFAQHVCNIIDKERGVASKFSYRQFEELILKPSSLLPSDKPLVIIIDALDECAERSDILLNILRDGVPRLPGMFRFLVTSRPTPDLDKHLSGQPHVLRQSLHVNEQSNLTDIRTYIFHNLVEIFKGKQPDAALVEAFSVATEGLFIWASTIFVYLRGAFDPEATLRRILDENHPKRLPPATKMDQLYTNIMERHDWSDPDFVQAYSAAMGMVLTAKEPLPISVLASLNPSIPLDIFIDILGQLRAVLHYLPTGQIRVFHKSFHDFMVTRSSDLPYHLSIADHEQQMAIFCLDILNQELKKPIPGTGYLVDNASLSKGIPHITDGVSEQLWYSCRFGINHCMSMLAPLPVVSAALRELIGVDFVRWIEICALKGSFTGIDPSFLTWLKAALPDIQEMVYSIPHLVALSSLSERLIYENRHNEALLVMQPVIEQYKQIIASGNVDLLSCFNSLGNLYLCCFECTGDVEDIDQAIFHHQSALKSTPVHANLPSYFNNLGNSYLCRFECAGDIEDIERAISNHQSALKFTPSSHANLPIYFNNLGNSYLCRFEHAGDLEDIDQAISHHQSALKFTPSSHVDLPSYFNSLGNSYLRRFERTCDPKDIDEAIFYHQSAFKFTSSGHVDFPSYLNNLGNSYLCRFESTGDLEDIDQAISHHQSALKFTPSVHADLSGRFNNLGNSYARRFGHTHHLPDVQNSIISYRLGAEAYGVPSIRLQSARHAAMLSSVYADSHCLTDFSLAINLLSEVAGEQMIHRRHANIQSHSDIVVSAAATALCHGKPDIALEWLEQGRCLMWNQIHQLRTPIDDLRLSSPSLADRFIHVAGALESLGTRSSSSILSTHSILAEDIRRQRNHTLLTAPYKQLLKEIRALPYFHDFLQPPKFINLLSSLPSNGPVIVFNIHETHCDALALQAGLNEPLHIPLKNFSLVQAEQLRKTLESKWLQSESEDGERGDGDHQIDHNIPHRVTSDPPYMSFVLEELWYKVVWPVLEALAYSTQTPPNPSERRRIWWCPTGPLAFLPLHAAGIYSSASQVGQCVFDFVVSSYTPTVRSLNEKCKASSTSSKCTSLVIISPDTPGIPYTKMETRNLKRLMDGTAVQDVLLLEDSEATRDKVKRGMETHSWAHFACGGGQDIGQPLKSGLYLHDGPLELLEIMKQQIPNGDLAFLSACQTSKGHVKLSEEVVHLAAGMLAAGYRGVVGTMWDISDRHGIEFAMEFYQYLLKEKGSEGLDSTQAAYALDHSTRKVREGLGEGDLAFRTWVPYVHFGY